MVKPPEHITPELIAACISGQATPEQWNQLQQWLLEAPENAAYVDAFKQVWDNANNLKPQPLVVDVDAAWSKLSGRIAAEDRTLIMKPNKGSWLRIAAILLPLILVGSVLLWLSLQPKMMELASMDQTVKETLPDGTRISLNKNSTLSYPQRFGKKTREVNLIGEAYFDVAHDSTHPFIIHAGNADVKVLGTAFNINAPDSSDFIDVTVASGKVQLYNPINTGDSSFIYLLAGEKGRMNKKNGKVWKINDIYGGEIYWASKTLIFKKTQLSVVIETLNHIYSKRIKLNNSELGKCSLTATFTDLSFETILDIIAKSFDLTVSKEGTLWVLDGKGC